MTKNQTNKENGKIRNKANNKILKWNKIKYPTIPFPLKVKLSVPKEELNLFQCQKKNSISFSALSAL